jgi:hypothetical protein
MAPPATSRTTSSPVNGSVPAEAVVAVVHVGQFVVVGAGGVVDT